MTQEQKTNLLLNRYNKLLNNPKDIKAPGTVKKLRRKLIKLGAI